MPLGPVGCRVLIHAKPAAQQSWDFCAKPGFYIGPALDSYRCFKLVRSNTNSQVILDTVKICHSYLSVPVPSAKEKIIHGLQVVAGAIRGAPPPTSVSQLKAITYLQEIFESWRALAPPFLCPTRRPAPSPPRVNSHESSRVVVTSPSSTSPTWSPSTAVRFPPQTHSLLWRLPLHSTSPLAGLSLAHKFVFLALFFSPVASCTQRVCVCFRPPVTTGLL
jgi:hypothetical protein